MYISNTPAKEQKSNALIIGILIIILSIILIGLYLVSGVLKGNISNKNIVTDTIANNAGLNWKIGDNVEFSGDIITRNDSTFFQYGLSNMPQVGLTSKTKSLNGLTGTYNFQGVVSDIKNLTGLLNTYIIDVTNVTPILAKSVDSSNGKLIANIGNKSIFLDRDLIIADPNYILNDGKITGGDISLDTFLCNNSSSDITKNCDQMQATDSNFSNTQGLNFYKLPETDTYYFYTPRYGINFSTKDDQQAKDFGNTVDIVDENYISQIISDHISSLCNDGTTNMVTKETLSYDPIKQQIKINGFDGANNPLSCLVSINTNSLGVEKQLIFDFVSFGSNGDSSIDSNTSSSNNVIQAPSVYTSSSKKSSSSISSIITIDLNATTSSQISSNIINTSNNTTSAAAIDLNNISSTSSIDANISSSNNISSDMTTLSGAVTYSQYTSKSWGYTAVFPRNFEYQVNGTSQQPADGINCYNNIILSNYNTRANGNDISILACNGTGDANSYAASKGYRLYKAGNNFFFATALTSDGVQALSNISFR